MTKQEEEVVSFTATPKGFVREVREEEKETPKDEVKPEPSARKLGSSNRSLARVLGALSAMIIGGAVVPVAGDPQKQNQSKENVAIVPPTAVPETTVPKNVYQDNSFDELIAMLDASQERAREMDATAKQVRADQKWERDHALEIQSEFWRRIHARGIKEPVQQSSAPLAYAKAVAPPKVVTSPKPRKEKNSGKANGKNNGANLRKDAQPPPASGEQTQKAGEDLKEELKEALHEQGEMEEQQSIPAPS